MKKNKDLIFVGVLIIASGILIGRFGYRKLTSQQGITQTISRQPSSLTAKTDDAVSGATKDESNSTAVAEDFGVSKNPDIAYVNHKQYFEDYFRKKPEVEKIYQTSLQIFGDHPEAKIVAEYFAEGIAREDNTKFSQYMHELIDDLNAGNQSVARLLLEKEAELQKDKFQYQMALNLTHVLKLPRQTKARLLGGALVMPFALDNNGSIDARSTNITNAMILLKSSQVSPTVIFSYIKKGLLVNKNNPAAFKEFQARANLYFPDMVDR